jgi:hypothetical protein
MYTITESLRIPDVTVVWSYVEVADNEERRHIW